MFKKLTNLAESVKEIHPNLFFNDFAKDEELKSNIVHYNTIDQLYNEGIDSDGRSLGEYSPYTKEIKQKNGQPFDRITLKDTGAFYDSFKVIQTQDGLLIVANSIKEDTNLRDEFGNEIVGLTDENYNKTVKEMRINAVLFLKKYLNV